MYHNLNLKESIKGIISICMFLVLPYVCQIPFFFLYSLKLINLNVYMIASYILLLTIYIIIYRKDLLKDFKDFKKNYKSILKTTIEYYLTGLIIMMLSNFIINSIGINNTANEELNRDILENHILFQFITAGFIAPIIEELVFRKSLRKVSDNKYIYITISALIFAIIHILSSINTLSDLKMLIHIIPYGAMGAAFASAYYKTDNIYGTIIIHGMHNIITLLLLLNI